MKSKLRNTWYLTAATLLLLAPGAFALQTVHESPDNKCRYDRRCKVAAAEGGSAALYLMLAGVTCVGAMAVSSRRREGAEKTA